MSSTPAKPYTSLRVKKYAALLVAMITCIFSINAQAIGYTLHIYQEPSKERVSSIPSRMLLVRLEMIMRKQGFEKGKSGDRFLLMPVMTLISKDSVSGSQPDYRIKIMVKLTIGDGLEGTKFATVSIPLEGKGSNEAKAYVEALRLLTPDNKDVAAFFAQGKQKIKEYYSKNCSGIIKSAEAFSAKEQYEMTILHLVSIPDSCAECKEKAMGAIDPYCEKYNNQQCTQRLASAKKIWTGGQTEENAKSALHQLAQIDPESSCYADAKSYYDQIMGYFKNQGKQVKDEPLKAPYKDDVEKGNARKELFARIITKHKNAGGTTTNYVTTDW